MDKLYMWHKRDIWTHVTDANNWSPAVYHELHESNLPCVSRIEFIRLKLSIFSAHVSGASVPYQHAVLHGPRRAPVEHARAVVLHLRLLKVKVLRLVVGDAGLDAARPGVGAAGRSGRRADDVTRGQTRSSDQVIREQAAWISRRKIRDRPKIVHPQIYSFDLKMHTFSSASNPSKQCFGAEVKRLRDTYCSRRFRITYEFLSGGNILIDLKYDLRYFLT